MDGVATSDPHRPATTWVASRSKTDSSKSRVRLRANRCHRGANDNHSDVTEKRDREGADMEITEIFSLGRDHHGDNDRRWYDDGWRNRYYYNRDWRHDDWDDRGYDNRRNC